MSKPIFLQNKKVCDRVRSVKKMLSQKIGKPVPISETVAFMFADVNIVTKIQGAEVIKKKRSKKEYVIKV